MKKIKLDLEFDGITAKLYGLYFKDFNNEWHNSSNLFLTKEKAEQYGKELKKTGDACRFIVETKYINIDY